MHKGVNAIWQSFVDNVGHSLTLRPGCVQIVIVIAILKPQGKSKQEILPSPGVSLLLLYSW